MSTEQLNRWLTLGANVGVLIGIFLLLLELKQNAELMRAQMAEARAANTLEAYRVFMQSDAWVEIRAKRRKARSVEEWLDQLSPAEYERVFYFALHEIHSVWIQFSQYQAGYLDEQTFRFVTTGQARRLVSLLPYMQFISFDDPEFNAYLDGIAVASGLPPIYSHD